MILCACSESKYISRCRNYLLLLLKVTIRKNLLEICLYELTYYSGMVWKSDKKTLKSIWEFSRKPVAAKEILFK